MSARAVSHSEWRTNLLLVLVGIGLPLVGLEVGLRIYHAEVKARSSYRPVDDARVVFAGKPHAWNEINSLGFRDREHSLQKPEGAFRVLVLGDSVTDGFGVDFGDVYTQRLQSLLDRRGAHDEVVSLGVSQYSTAQEVALFEDVGLAMSPDLVILAYVLNDPAADGSINDFFRRDRAPSLALAWLRSGLRFLTPGRGRRVVGCVSHDYYSELHCDADKWAASEAALDRLAQLSQQHGLPVLLVLFPLLDSAKASFEPYAWDAPRRQVLEAATRRHFATLDLLEAFAERRPADLALNADDLLHPNRGGHEIAATALHHTLVAQRLIH